MAVCVASRHLQSRLSGARGLRAKTGVFPGEPFAGLAVILPSTARPYKPLLVVTVPFSDLLPFPSSHALSARPWTVAAAPETSLPSPSPPIPASALATPDPQTTTPTHNGAPLRTSPLAPCLPAIPLPSNHRPVTRPTRPPSPSRPRHASLPRPRLCTTRVSSCIPSLGRGSCSETALSPHHLPATESDHLSVLCTAFSVCDRPCSN